MLLGREILSMVVAPPLQPSLTRKWAVNFPPAGAWVWVSVTRAKAAIGTSAKTPANRNILRIAVSVPARTKGISGPGALVHARRPPCFIWAASHMHAFHIHALHIHGGRGGGRGFGYGQDRGGILQLVAVRGRQFCPILGAFFTGLGGRENKRAEGFGQDHRHGEFVW